VKRYHAEPPLSRAEREAGVQAFEVVYQANRDLIYRYVLCWVGNRQDAEDVTAQVFLKAWSGVDVQRSKRAIQKWLYQVARTTITDSWRQRSRLPTSSLEGLLETADWDECEQEESRTTTTTSPVYVQRILPLLSTRSPEEWLVDQEDAGQEQPTSPERGSASCVHALLQALPKQYRAVLIGRFLHGLSLKETALGMGMTVANVKVIQLRALKRAADLGQSVCDPHVVVGHLSLWGKEERMQPSSAGPFLQQSVHPEKQELCTSTITPCEDEPHSP
jgi:RNA polymerase sigma-70 factor, ECF subfamily